MYSNDDDLDEYVQEAKNELTKVRNDAWASFQEALLVECVKNEHWNVKVRGQPPQSRHDVLNIVTSKQWVDKVGEKVAETTVAHLTVGMYTIYVDDYYPTVRTLRARRRFRATVRTTLKPETNNLEDIVYIDLGNLYELSYNLIY